MCEITRYPGLYNRANALLRREKINPQVPGYELLKIAIVIWHVEKSYSWKELLKKVKDEGKVIPSNKELVSAKDEVEQWMLEAIKAAGIDISVEKYVKQLSEELR